MDSSDWGVTCMAGMPKVSNSSSAYFSRLLVGLSGVSRDQQRAPRSLHGRVEDVLPDALDAVPVHHDAIFERVDQLQRCLHVEQLMALCILAEIVTGRPPLSNLPTVEEMK